MSTDRMDTFTRAVDDFEYSLEWYDHAEQERTRTAVLALHRDALDEIERLQAAAKVDVAALLELLAHVRDYAGQPFIRAIADRIEAALPKDAP